MRRLCLLALSGLAVLLQGCGAHFNSIYRVDSLNGDVSVRSVDAKQRLIYARKTDSGMVICPEPSPDALAANAAGAEASASQLGKIGGLAFGAASGERAGSIGLRTQTISLLRDQATQLCLRRMAGNPGEEQMFTEELRRLQVSALGMLAIEQLTGVSKAPPVIVNVQAGSSKSSTGKSSDDAQAKQDVNVTVTSSGSAGTDSAPTTQPTAEVAKAVVDILKLIIDEGFNSYECRMARKKAAEARGPIEIDGSANAVKFSCPRPATEAEGELLIAGLPKENAQVVASKSVQQDPNSVFASKAFVSKALDKLPASDRPLEGYKISVFLCPTASRQAFQDFARSRIQPLTSGLVDVVVLDDKRFASRSKMFDPQNRPFAAVVYDDADSEEKAFADRLVAELQPQVTMSLPGLKVDLRANNTGLRTPYYLSAWVCP